MGVIRVRRYERRDGTVVQSHDRKGNPVGSAVPDRPPVEGLFTLADSNNEIRPLASPPMGINTLRKNMYSVKEPGIFESLSDYRRSNNTSLTRVVGSGAGLIAGVAGAGAFVFSAPVVFAAGAALGGVFFLGSALAEHVVFPLVMNREAKKSSLFPEKVSQRELNDFCDQYGWQTKPQRRLTPTPLGSVRSKVFASGLGVAKWKEKRGQFRKDIFEYDVSAYFYPGVDHTRADFDKPICLPGVNLQDATLVRSMFVAESDFSGANFRNANLQQMKLEGKASGASFEGADMRGSFLVECDLTGANFEGANLKGAWLPRDIDDFNLTREQVEDLFKTGAGHYLYTQHSFEDAVATLGVTNAQFEFLVASGVIQVRDNRTREVVRSGFDPEGHHVPSWELQAAERILAEQSVGDAPQR